MAQATNLNPGMAIRFNNEVCIVVDTQHRTPGNLRGFVQATLRSTRTGKSSVHRFASTDKIEQVSMARKKFEFSYKDPSGWNFIDPDTYEPLVLQDDIVGGHTDYITENMAVDIVFCEDSPVSLELPASVELKVTDAPEGLKGDSTSNVMKTITLETGLTIQAPLFIKDGDTVKVTTADGKYQGRV